LAVSFRNNNGYNKSGIFTNLERNLESNLERNLEIRRKGPGTNSKGLEFIFLYYTFILIYM